jgi:hypothetical protein
MSYELTGKLVEKYDTVQRTENFRTREFVVEKTDEINGKTIHNFVKFQCVQDRTAIVDKINPGDNIKVYFNIKGTKWEKNDKVNYITNLDAWRVEQLMPASTTYNDGDFGEPMDTFTDNAATDPDDLPF